MHIAPLLILAISAHSATIKVPEDMPTLQAAVDAASPGDTIRLKSGNHCGAFIPKRLEIAGESATIIGCPAPAHPSGFRVGLWLSNVDAGGTSIQGLTFDGQGVSNTNLSPLGAAIFSRDLSDGNKKINNIEIHHVKILGTAQAITNNGGDNWNVHHNDIENLSVFDCTSGARLCFGGDGIVSQLWRGAVPTGQQRSRPTNNLIAYNKISGTIPTSLTEFSYAGVFVQNSDGSTIEHNQVSIPDNPRTDAAGVALLVTNACCGNPSFAPGSIGATVTSNNGRESEYGLIVDPDNMTGLTLRGNFGVNLVGDEVKVVKNRSIKTLQEFP